MEWTSSEAAIASFFVIDVDDYFESHKINTDRLVYVGDESMPFGL